MYKLSSSSDDLFDDRNLENFVNFKVNCENRRLVQVNDKAELTHPDKQLFQ